MANTSYDDGAGSPNTDSRWQEALEFIARARASVAQFADDLETSGKLVRRRAVDVFEAASDRVEEEPVQAMVAAFAVGCALGLLFSFRRR
jgi:ElaB/YqjD/DUF883 family membrane-anchored ribosome-binding protein